MSKGEEKIEREWFLVSEVITRVLKQRDKFGKPALIPKSVSDTKKITPVLCKNIYYCEWDYKKISKGIRPVFPNDSPPSKEAVFFHLEEELFMKTKSLITACKYIIDAMSLIEAQLTRKTLKERKNGK